MKIMGIALLMALAIGCNRDGDSGQAGTAAKVAEDNSYESTRPLRNVAQGDEVWAVYVYTGQPGAAMDQAVDRLVAQGLDRAQLQRRELACQEGAMEKLNLSGEAMAVSLYFGDETTARNFAQLVSAPLDNVVRVKYMCKID